jgi:hypothetical protein
MAVPAAVYRPRYPQATGYYRCVEDYFETFVRIYDEHFSRQYGFWRPYVEQVIYRYLDCGDLHNGFARVKLVLDLIGDVMTAAMNISWHFPASAATSARPATRKGLWNSVSGSFLISVLPVSFHISTHVIRYHLYQESIIKSS